MPTNRQLLLFETLRHLRVKQIMYRLWYLLTKVRIERNPAPERRALRAASSLPEKVNSYNPAAGFCFLNHEVSIDTTTNWNDSAQAKLWLYNLHYFDWLQSSAVLSGKADSQPILNSWIAQNPVGFGNGWEPYPVSLRVVNWVKYLTQYRGSTQPFDDSLALQVRWLTKKLEYHLLANHLWANAKALLFAGLYFGGREGNEWLAMGKRLIDAQLIEQITDDGAHFERSPMYHAIVLEDLLDCINFAVHSDAVDDACVASWQATAARMLGFLEMSMHPDRDLAFFNDTTLGIALKPAQLLAYADALGVEAKSVSNKHSCSDGVQCLEAFSCGFVRTTTATASLIADVGNITPSYQPGHAHAQSLSFELSILSQRVLVNTGISTYEIGDLRDHQRSTKAHNTLEIAGKNSSDVWAGFRVAKRAKVLDYRCTCVDGNIEISASHNGYSTLFNRRLHHRTFQVSTDKIKITDRIDREYKDAVANYLLHPAIGCEVNQDDTSGVFILPNNVGVPWRAVGATVSTERADWYPGFGLSVATTRLSLQLSANECFFELDLSKVYIDTGNR